MASVTKKTLKFDMRGRCLEAFVVFNTLATTLISWNIIWGFFGRHNYCTGLPKTLVALPEVSTPVILHLITRAFTVIDSILQFSDRMVVRNLSILCKRDSQSCFSTISSMDPQFLLEERGAACARDVTALMPLWMLAGMILLFGVLFKKRDRDRRNRGGVGRNRVPLAPGDRHLHQD